MNHIKVYSDIAILYGHNISFKLHANHAAKIIIAEEPVSVASQHTAVKSQGVIVKANTLHKVKSDKGFIVSLYIDLHSNIGTRLNSLVKNGILKLSNNTADRLLRYFNNGLENHLTKPEVETFLVETLLNETPEPVMVLDERIKKVINVINSSTNHSVKFSDLLTLSALSESRLIHLFKKEVGIPIRKYVLWCRVLKALKALSSGRNVKQSAKLAGFTDAAHLSRAFASMFGISPSTLK